MEARKTEKIKYPRKKMIIGMVLLVIVGAAHIIQYTALMRDYTFNYITTVIQNNTVNFVVIGILLIFMNV